jgi:hypothetical protein
MINKMTMEIDFFEILKLIDACFGGYSGVSMGFIVKVTNRYDSFSEEEKAKIFENINGIKRLARNSYTEKMLARYNPDNQYLVETKSEGQLRAFKFKDVYHVNHDWRIFQDEIIKIEKI